ncbi:hypothetical protein IKF27_01755 [Candidatus Saccharibacteria bacterium]|nr:hypothetical protein [Candidatus Saccharibacteria bacterium]
MLNYFWWYAIVWTVVLVLYWLDLSDFNHPLDFGLVIFLVSTSLVALVLGWIFRKEFIFKKSDKAHISKVPILLIFIGAMLEFIHAGSIPLLSILSHTENYGDFQSLPGVHVAIVAAGLYYAIKCFYCILCKDKIVRKKYILCYFAILGLFALYYFRACIMIILFVSLNLFIANLRLNRKINWKYIAGSILVVFTSLYAYGGVGNLRHGYSWNDNSYIERLGRYKSFPDFIPKQFMWTYSYLTTPLANLNDNVIRGNKKQDVGVLIGALLPNTVAKMVFDDNGDTGIYLDSRYRYFNAVTGWCKVFVGFGYLGMYILAMAMFLFGIYGVKTKSKDVTGKIVYIAIMGVVFCFMFFYDTLNYVAISLPMWASLIVLAFFDKIRCLRRRF